MHTHARLRGLHQKSFDDVRTRDAQAQGARQTRRYGRSPKNTKQRKSAVHHSTGMPSPVLNRTEVNKNKMGGWSGLIATQINLHTQQQSLNNFNSKESSKRSGSKTQFDIFKQMAQCPNESHQYKLTEQQPISTIEEQPYRIENELIHNVIRSTYESIKQHQKQARRQNSNASSISQKHRYPRRLEGKDYSEQFQKAPNKNMANMISTVSNYSSIVSESPVDQFKLPNNKAPAPINQHKQSMSVRIGLMQECKPAVKQVNLDNGNPHGNVGAATARQESRDKKLRRPHHTLAEALDSQLRKANSRDDRLNP